MRFIRFYKFGPKVTPPFKIEQLHTWFESEISEDSIQPVDVFEIKENGPINGSDKNKPLAMKLFAGLLNLKKAYKYFKNRKLW